MQLKKLISYQVIRLFPLPAHSACTQDIKTGYGLWTVDTSNDDQYIALGGDDSLLMIKQNF